MNQHLTVSNTIVNYLDRSLPAYKRIKAHDVINIIEQNFIVSDRTKKHLQNIVSEIEKIEDSKHRKILQDIIVNWLDNRSKFVECDMALITNLIELSKKDTDKIYFDPTLSQIDVGKLKTQHSSVEIHNENSLLEPKDIHKLKNCPCTIRLRDNIKYNVVALFEPYLREAKEIIFQDPFLINPSAFYNFRLLINCIKANKISAFVHSKHNYLGYGWEKDRNKREMNYDSFVKYADQKNIYLSEWKRADHKERFIITDKLEIYIPGGLDLFNNDGTIRMSEPDKEIKNIKVEYRQIK
jgi:hypothetical protein